MACGFGSLPTAGSMVLSSDGYRIGSEEGTGGLPATMTIINNVLDGPYDVTVTQPIMTYPAGFAAGTATPQIAYTAIAVGLMAPVTQSYTPSQTSFHVAAIVVSMAMTFQSRIVTTGGLKQGAYSTKTTVTCS
jgi:hypothetical protein